MIKRVVAICLCVAMLAWFIPVCVHAENESTYTVLSANECLLGYKSGNYKYYFQSTSDVRLCLFKYANNSTNTVRALVSTSPFSYSIQERAASNQNTCSVPSTAAQLYNGYYVHASRTSANITTITDVAIPINGPQSASLDIKDVAIYYTYGEGSVGPTEPINWGLLRDVTYQSRIAGQGSASVRNVDYLSWDPVADANGNDISECEVEIQACYGKFTANDLTGLFELDYQDIVIEDSVSLATVPASQGTYSISWGAVIDELNGWDYQSLYAHSVNNQIQKNGWYYQIRLIGSDDVVGQWQTMYTPLSQSAQASETILNQTSYNMNVYQIYEQLLLINNQVSITVDFDGTEYTVQNPDDGEEPQEGTDYWDILRQMLNGIVQIVGNIQKLPERLFAKIEELFTPQELDDTFHQQFTEQYEDYMASEQTTIYDFLDGVEALEPYVESLAPGDTGAHACILTWEDVTLDLTSFGAGEVTFIQGGTFSLTNAFLDVIHAFGLTYEDYEFLASAVIYLWLCVFIWHKFIHFLEKE